MILIRDHYRESKEILFRHSKGYYEEGRKDLIYYCGELVFQYEEKRPWLKHLTLALERCYLTEHKDFKDYGGIGIECVLTPSSIRKIWIEDGAKLMRVPALKRYTKKEGFIFRNCKFVDAYDLLGQAIQSQRR